MNDIETVKAKADDSLIGGKNNQPEKLKISILGDSISTYEGYTVHQGLFYDRFLQNIAGIHSVEDTWWMKVIRALDGELLSNDSFSGSTVYGNVAVSGTSLKRIENLRKQTDPDVILVSMGTNDWGSYVLPTEFKKSYDLMLRRITDMYPDAKVYCATIIRGDDPEDKADLFMNVEGCLSPVIYSDIIRECAADAGVYLADLAIDYEPYATIDGIHPNKKGMKQIADLWIREIQKLK